MLAEFIMLYLTSGIMLQRGDE